MVGANFNPILIPKIYTRTALTFKRKEIESRTSGPLRKIRIIRAPAKNVL